ncbi:MAG TPA: type II restriction endonuclease, partial [Flavobacteriales bacterium]|nr:type II restriction endonuclease [Flavobacteriales bacterium]
NGDGGTDDGAAIKYQTTQMAQELVQLVVPTAVFPTFTDAQRSRMLNVGGFIELVRSRQA